jgi:membrane protease YdiL (CAAX protease family)
LKATPPPNPPEFALRGFLSRPLGALIQILIVAASLLILPTHSPWSPVLMAAIAFGLIWFMREEWNDLGFHRPPTRPRRWITEGLVVGLFWQFVALGILVPALNGLFGVQPQFAGRAGDWAYFLSALVIFGAAHAFAKGLAYRAFLIHRLETLFGRTALGARLAFAGASILFGLGNWHQGVVGVIVGVTVGAVFNGLFFWSRRNVWPTILAHFAYNTAALTLVFLGRL